MYKYGCASGSKRIEDGLGHDVLPSSKMVKDGLGHDVLYYDWVLNVELHYAGTDIEKYTHNV